MSNNNGEANNPNMASLGAGAAGPGKEPDQAEVSMEQAELLQARLKIQELSRALDNSEATVRSKNRDLSRLGNDIGKALSILQELAPTVPVAAPRYAEMKDLLSRNGFTFSGT